MIKKFVSILCILLTACSSYSKEKSDKVIDSKIINLSYTYLDGMNGDIFNFRIKSNQDINTQYQEKKYKFSHLICQKINNYSILGSISIDEGLLEKNEYIYPGYFKVCTNESINNCLNKVELIDILPEELKCKITFGGLLQKEIVVSDNIIINKNQILKAEKK
jgi:hypothetical protein